jgi:hypothetical protein
VVLQALLVGSVMFDAIGINNVHMVKKLNLQIQFCGKDMDFVLP